MRSPKGNALPVITTDGATFIDDNSLFFTGCFFIAPMKGFKILLFGLWTHMLMPPFPNLASVTSIYESTFLFYLLLR